MARLQRNAVLLGLLRLALMLGVILVLHRLYLWGDAQARMADAGAMLTIGTIAGLLCIYALMLAIPFVPGVEIGLALLMAGGAGMAPIVYGATVAGLMLAFAVGRHFPLPRLQGWANRLGLRRVARALVSIEKLTREERLRLIEVSLPRWVPGSVLPYRYVVLGLLINIPGNMALGGGGGLLLLAGLSGLFAPLATLVTLAVAVLPVPLAVGLLGSGFF